MCRSEDFWNCLVNFPKKFSSQELPESTILFKPESADGVCNVESGVKCPFYPISKAMRCLNAWHTHQAPLLALSGLTYLWWDKMGHCQYERRNAQVACQGYPYYLLRVQKCSAHLDSNITS